MDDPGADPVRRVQYLCWLAHGRIPDFVAINVLLGLGKPRTKWGSRRHDRKAKDLDHEKIESGDTNFDNRSLCIGRGIRGDASSQFRDAR